MLSYLQLFSLLNRRIVNLEILILQIVRQYLGRWIRKRKRIFVTSAVLQGLEGRQR